MNKFTNCYRDRVSLNCLINTPQILSFEKHQLEAALSLACDLKVVDQELAASAARKFELELKMAEVRAERAKNTHFVPALKPESPPSPPAPYSTTGGRDGARAVEGQRCSSR